MKLLKQINFLLLVELEIPAWMKSQREETKLMEPGGKGVSDSGPVIQAQLDGPPFLGPPALIDKSEGRAK